MRAYGLTDRIILVSAFRKCSSKVVDDIHITIDSTKFLLMDFEMNTIRTASASFDSTGFQRKAG
jgi:hypothetical protein